MILRDLMEEKQLNFNRPLLSVRRISSTVASETDNKRKTADNSLDRLQPLPGYKSELMYSGPVRNAGAVPFVWEKTPGRPKDESKLQTQAVEQPPITPNLPPGRVSKVKQQDSDMVLKCKEMRTGSTLFNSQSVASLDKKVTKHESSREGIEDKESSDSDDGDETYLDALDTLSRTESFFMSCSGLSGWDDQEVQVQPSSESFSSDQLQARDFMIDRFLPAAKAMTSETPQYASKKPLVGLGQQKQRKKVVSTERSPPVNQHNPRTLWHYTQNIIDSEGSEDDSDDSENYTTTACGLFPRFCLLNPIPGLRMEDKVQSNAGRGMQAKSTASHIETTKECTRPPYSKSEFTKEKEILGVLEKSKHGTDPHQKGCSNLLACERPQRETSYESPVAEKTLYVDSVHKVKSQTNHKGDDFEALRRDRGHGIYKNLSIDSPLENSQRLDVANAKAALQARSSEFLNSPLVRSENSSNDMQMEMTNHSKKIMDSEKLGNQGSDLDQDLVVMSSPKVVHECKKTYSESKVSSSGKNYGILIQNSKVDNTKSQRTAKWIDQGCILASSKVGDVDGKIDLESQSYFGIPLVLPSLKAPSESWLKRTLPTISSRNTSSQSNLAPDIYARSQTPPNTASSMCPKWETIVKSSIVHHGNQHPHEELLKPIAED